MAAITITDLNNAKTDVDHVANFANSPLLTATDRLGRTKRTLAGIDADAESRMDAHDADAISRMNAHDADALARMSTIDAAATTERTNIQAAADLVLAATGYAVPVAYTSGLSMTVQTQTVSYNGETYAPIQSQLPFTTSGTFETAKFRLIQGVSGADLAASTGTALVGHVQSGAGAVLRTVQSKLREVFSVTDFGATGNGVTDDTAACKAALAAGAGKTVLFPPGDYLVSDSLPVPANTCVMGAGYGSRIRTPAAGWNMSTTDHFGILNAKGVDNVRITNVRLYGTKTQDQTHSPKLVYIETANDLTIDHCWLENQAFEGIWGGGVPSASRRIVISNNHFTNIGYPNAYVGLPAIQPNGFEVLITGNELYDVGSGVSVSGINYAVVGNTIRQFQLDAIGTGDGGSSGNASIVGNTIEFTADPVNARKGILLDSGGGTKENFNVSGNSIRIIGNAAYNTATAISCGSAENMEISANAIEIDVRGKGIFINNGSATGTYASIQGNTVRVTNESGASTAIGAIPNGAGNTLTVLSSGNTVYGVTRANGSYAFDYNVAAGGTLNATCAGDYFTQGNFRLGPTNYASGQLDGLAVYMRSDITKSADFHSAPQLGVLNLVAPAGQTTIAAGVITLAGVVGGVFSEARRTRVKIETEGASASDDLDTINGTQDGDVLILSALNAAHTVVVKDGTGNMKLAGDFSMDNSEDRIMLINDGGTLFELCRSDNGA